MAISVNTNITSLIAQKSLNSSTNAIQKAMQRLTTGLKINNAGDDAAGLVISENMNAQLNGSKRAMQNIQDAQNFAAVAEGAMISIGEHLQRINDLMVQGASDTNSLSARNAILVEVQQRLSEIERIATGTSFNGATMIDGTYGKGKTPFIVQIGPYTDTEPNNPINTIDITNAFTNCRLSQLGTAGVGILLPDTLNPDKTGYNPEGDEFREYLDKIQIAIDLISSSRGLLGGYLNRMESSYDNLSLIVENLTTAKSRIVDTDIAEASSEMVKQQILQQTTASILVQANQMPQMALNLIQ